MNNNQRRVSVLTCLPSFLVLAICSFVTPADALNNTTGWQSFRPIPNQGSQTCVSENFGAAVNTCGGPVDMIFELVRPNTTSQQLTVCQRPGVNRFAFTCRIDDLDGVNDSFSSPGSISFSPPPFFNCSNFPFSSSLGHNTRLHCFSVPVNGGIKSFEL